MWVYKPSQTAKTRWAPSSGQAPRARKVGCCVGHTWWLRTGPPDSRHSSV
jgi:hypothetical protein